MIQFTLAYYAWDRDDARQTRTDLRRQQGVQESRLCMLRPLERNGIQPAGKTLCVAVISATVVPALLDLRVDNTLPGMRAFVRLTRGMRIVKYRFDGEWEFSAGQVRYTAKEVRICITLE